MLYLLMQLYLLALQLKDLKRQVQSERKRAEKLQEKLQEFLSDSKSRQCSFF